MSITKSRSLYTNAEADTKHKTDNGKDFKRKLEWHCLDLPLCNIAVADEGANKYSCCRKKRIYGQHRYAGDKHCGTGTRCEGNTDTYENPADDSPCNDMSILWQAKHKFFTAHRCNECPNNKTNVDDKGKDIGSFCSLFAQNADHGQKTTASNPKFLDKKIHQYIDDGKTAYPKKELFRGIFDVHPLTSS